MKEYPITLVLQETNSDPFDANSDPIYRGVLRCKGLDIEYAITEPQYDAEEVMAMINELLGNTRTIKALVDHVDSAIKDQESYFIDHIESAIKDHVSYFRHKGYRGY